MVSCGGVFDNNILLRHCRCWVVLPCHAMLPPSIAPGHLLMCPCWESDQRTDSAFANPIKMTTSTWFSPCLVPRCNAGQCHQYYISQYRISADTVTSLCKGPQKPSSIRDHRNSSPHQRNVIGKTALRRYQLSSTSSSWENLFGWLKTNVCFSNEEKNSCSEESYIIAIC